MFLITEADAHAIRAIFSQEGELSAAIELRRRFPRITDNVKARAHVRTIAGWKPLSRAARSRDSAIHVACELLHQTLDVRRILEPNGRSIERPELDEHFDGGRFPGLRRRPYLS
jgi:hypothetical protein